MILMPTVFEKLNLKDQRSIVVLDAPSSFEVELATLDGVTIVREAKRTTPVQFAIAFATKQDQLDRVSKVLAAAAVGDAVVWIAYPKGTSKKYNCEFNRDSGWTVLRAAGYDSVRMVAIDDDWSALRFRRAEFIRPTKTVAKASETTSARPSRSRK